MSAQALLKGGGISWYQLTYNECYYCSADSSKANAIGQTAYDIASFWNHRPIVKLLENNSSTDDPCELVHFFAVQDLDRCSERRKDQAWLDQTMFSNPDTKFLLFINAFPVLDGKSFGLVEFAYDELQSYIADHKPAIIFLGIDTRTGKPLFAVDFNSGLDHTAVSPCN